MKIGPVKLEKLATKCLNSCVITETFCNTSSYALLEAALSPTGGEWGVNLIVVKFNEVNNLWF